MISFKKAQTRLNNGAVLGALIGAITGGVGGAFVGGLIGGVLDEFARRRFG